VSFKIGMVIFRHTFLVSKLTHRAAGTLGINFMTFCHGVLDSEERTMTLCRSLYCDSSEALEFKLREDEYEADGKHGLISHVFVSIISL
jgi:hypothetical protein